MQTARSPNVPALTGIRGIAALLVAIYHYFRPLMPPGSVALRLLGRGYLYVDLFFILSGYVMAHTYGALFAERRHPASILRFWWKRFARVYPIYGGLLVTMLTAYALVHGDFVVHRGWWIGIGLPHPWRDIPLNLMLMPSWGIAHGVVGQAWSVSVECAAYLAFPFLVPLLLGERRLGFGLAFAIAAALPCLAVLAARGDGLYHAGTLDLWDGPPALLRGFGGFILGMGLRRIALMPRALARPLGTTLAWTIAAGAAALGILVLSSAAYLGIERPSRALLRRVGPAWLHADPPAQLVLDMRADDLVEAGFRPEA